MPKRTIICPTCQKEFTTRHNQVKCCSKRCGYINRYPPIEILFWQKVDKSGGPDACWLWTDHKASNGYGHLTTGKRVRSAHRLAYELTYGEIPEGKSILHTCPGGLDRKDCVNPTHLRPGTAQDNMTDMSKRRRVRKSKKKLALLPI